MIFQYTLFTGLYTFFFFLCSSIDCGTPPDIPYAYVEFNETEFGSTAHYYCYENYTSSGDRYIMCEASGNWSDSDFKCCAGKLNSLFNNIIISKAL